MAEKKQICICETYKNTFMPHGRHNYAKSDDMAKATVCAYSQSDHVLPHLNVYCDVVPNVQALIFLTRIQMISIPTTFFQIVFTFII